MQDIITNINIIHNRLNNINSLLDLLNAQEENIKPEDEANSTLQNISKQIDIPPEKIRQLLQMFNIDKIPEFIKGEPGEPGKTGIPISVPSTKPDIIKTIAEKVGVPEEAIDNVTGLARTYGLGYMENRLREHGLTKSADALLSKKIGMDTFIDPTIKPLLTKQLECDQIGDDTEEKKDCEENIRNYKYGVYGDYLRCISTIGKIHENFTPDISDKYTVITPFSGGKSGAYVFLVRDKHNPERKFIFKLYALKILDAIQDRDVREIFTTCALSGGYGFPVVYDYGTTQYNSSSTFWKAFKASYIDCVPDKNKLKDYKLYTRVYYIVTSISGDKELNKKNLLKYTETELISILYQLAIIFKYAKEKVPYFVHNDLHPGNIFIDDSYRGKLVNINDEVQIYGPRVSIIDFDLVISDQYYENLAKGRQYIGKYFIQEAMITLLNTYFGINNTIAIIDHTAELWYPPLIENNDDFRLWYIYLMLFEIIIIYKKNFSDEIEEIKKKEEKLKNEINAIEGSFVLVSDTMEQQKKKELEENQNELLKYSGPFALNLNNIKEIIGNYKICCAFRTFDNFIEYINKNKGYIEKEMEEIEEIYIEGQGKEKKTIKKINKDKIPYFYKLATVPSPTTPENEKNEEKKNKIIKIKEIIKKLGFDQNNEVVIDFMSKNQKIFNAIKRKIKSEKSDLGDLGDQIQQLITKDKEDELFPSFLTSDQNIFDYIKSKLDFKGDKISNFSDLVKTINKKLYNIIPEDLENFIIKAVNKLEIETYNKTSEHFGTHNNRVGIKINFGTDKEIKLPFYNKGETINLTLTKYNNNDNRIIGLFTYGNFIEINLKNIVFNDNLKIDIFEGKLMTFFTKIFNVSIGKIIIHKETGEITIYSMDDKENKDENVRKYVTYLLNKGIQSIIREAINCPGVVFDMNDFTQNVLPLIEMILRYLYDIKAIETTRLIISNNVPETDKNYVSESEEINIINIIDSVRNKIDEKIQEKIIETYRKSKTHRKKIEQAEKRKANIKQLLESLRTNYKFKELERDLIRDNNIEASSFQHMINNIVVDNKILPKESESFYKTYPTDLIKFFNNINSLLSFITIYMEKKYDKIIKLSNDLYEEIYSVEKLREEIISIKEIYDKIDLNKDYSIGDYGEITKEVTKKTDSIKELYEKVKSIEGLDEKVKLIKELCEKIGVEQNVELVEDLKRLEEHNGLDKIIKSIVRLYGNFELIINLNKNIEPNKRFYGDIESIKKLTEDIESIKNLTEDIESIKNLTEDIESIKKLTEDIESIKKLNDNIKSIEKKHKNELDGEMKKTQQLYELALENKSFIIKNILTEDNINTYYRNLTPEDPLSNYIQTLNLMKQNKIKNLNTMAEKLGQLFIDNVNQMKGDSNRKLYKDLLVMYEYDKYNDNEKQQIKVNIGNKINNVIADILMPLKNIKNTATEKKNRIS